MQSNRLRSPILLKPVITSSSLRHESPPARDVYLIVQIKKKLSQSYIYIPLKLYMCRLVSGFFFPSTSSSYFCPMLSLQHNQHLSGVFMPKIPRTLRSCETKLVQQLGASKSVGSACQRGEAQTGRRCLRCLLMLPSPKGP